jgi:histidine ammonia-lyase
MKINNFLELKDFQKIIIGNEKIELDESLLSRVDKSFQFLKEFSKIK